MTSFNATPDQQQALDARHEQPTEVFEPAAGVALNNLVEIGNVPKHCSSKALLTLLITHTRVCPRKLDICLKSTERGDREIALAEYRNERDALMAADRIRRSPFGQKWEVRIINKSNANQGI